MSCSACIADLACGGHLLAMSWVHAGLSPPSPLLLLLSAFLGKESRGHSPGGTTNACLPSLPWLFRGPGSQGTCGISSKGGLVEAVEKMHLFLLEKIWQYFWILYTFFFPSKIASYNNFGLLVFGLGLRGATIKIKPYEDLCGSTLHINKGPFPSVQTLQVTSLLNPQGQYSSSTQRTSLMLNYCISPFYDSMEQSRRVNIFLMFSAGLHSMGSGLITMSAHHWKL